MGRHFTLVGNEFAIGDFTLPHNFGNMEVGGDCLLCYNRIGKSDDGACLPQSIGRMKVGGDLDLSCANLDGPLPESFGTSPGTIGGTLWIGSNGNLGWPDTEAYQAQVTRMFPMLTVSDNFSPSRLFGLEERHSPYGRP